MFEGLLGITEDDMVRSIGGEGIGRKSIAVLLKVRPAGGVRLQVGLEES